MLLAGLRRAFVPTTARAVTRISRPRALATGRKWLSNVPQTLLTKETLRKLPKAELHCHLDGSVRISTILELAKEQKVELPTFDYNALRNMIVVPPDCQSLVQYLKGFYIVLPVLQTPYAITRVMYELCEDAVADGVQYIEVRFSPILHIQQGMSLSQVMEAAVDGLEMAEHRLQITARIIICGMRHMSPDVTEKLAEITWRYRHRGVIAFDLAGPEDGFSSKHHRAAFDLIRAKDLKCTLHSGEAAGPESILDSIRFCGAQRIGHGTRLRESPSLLQYVVDRRIPIEVCVTSNFQTKAVQHLEDHPVRQYFDAGVITVPCTDNRTMSNITLSDEYDLLQRKFGFTPIDIVRLIDYSFSAAFSSRKRRLRSEALKQCIDILREVDKPSADAIANDTHYYFAATGVDLAPTRGYYGYWGPTGPHKNPPLTAEIVRALPKADVNCRLAGSVSVPQVWEELQREGGDTLSQLGIPDVDSADKLAAVLRPPTPHTPSSLERAKRILARIVQSPAQIERAMNDVVSAACNEGIRYIELIVRPLAHTQKGLLPEDVILTVLKAKERLEGIAGNPRIGLVISVSAGRDDPITFRNTAELTVKYAKSGVCGFGVFGPGELEPSWYPFFRSTFDYLKEQSIKVVISAGVQHSPETIRMALHEGGAARLSGAFQLHLSPRLMTLIADQDIPVELSVSDKLAAHTCNLTFVGNPIRLYIDNGVPVTICSFHKTITVAGSSGLSEQLLRIAQECNLSAAELLGLIMQSFRHNFQEYQIREEMFKKAWDDACSLLAAKGFKYFMTKRYFPTK